MKLMAIFVLVLNAALHAGDANSLQQLTVEDAQKLAADKSGRLWLDGLKTISPGVAKELARHEGWLTLNGLTSLSSEVATELRQHKGSLHLNGLAALRDEAAAALAGHRGELGLNGLTTISEESAKALARHSGGRLMLKGLTKLSGEAAKALSQRKGGGPIYQVHLDGLATLSPEAATALAGMHPHNWGGRMPAFKTVPDDVAKALSKREHGMSMPGLTTISDEAAKLLLPKTGGNLPVLKTLSPAAARVLAKARGHLVLDSLTSLSDEAAKALTEDANNRGNLYLNGLAAITPDAARAICGREGYLYLGGLTTISDDVLKALVEHRSPGYARPIVYLDGLTTLSDEGASVLASWEKWSGELPALSLISSQSAMALAASQRFKGSLPALKTLSPEVARALAQRKGNLSLGGLTTIPNEVAAALAEHQGGTLSLGGLKNLSDGAAAALSHHNGRLSLGGLTTLSGSAARALAGYQGDWLLFDGLSTLSEDAAKALAQRKGVVSVIGLKTLSDETVKALKANPLIILPDSLQRRTIAEAPAPADARAFHDFLDTHCADCHGDGSDKGDFELNVLKRDDIGGRVAYASILERLRAGDMPPARKPRPGAAAAQAVMKWISEKLDTPLAGPSTYFTVNEKPIDGNRLPHAILFGGPRGPVIPPPPRLWRLSPKAYSSWAAEFNAHGLQKPFGLIPEPGFKDFSALYFPDDGASGLHLSNADLIVKNQIRHHKIVPAAGNKGWPNEHRTRAATAEEQAYMKDGVRVSGGGAFAPLLHPRVAPNRQELEAAIRQQFSKALAREPGANEMEAMIGLYKEVARQGDLPLAGKTMLMAPLMAPEAILRFEVGRGGDVRPGVRMLSPRETAMALSLALGDKRERGLFEAARQGQLAAREEVAGHLRRILDTPQIGKPRVLRFFREYFDYHRAPEVFKDPLPDHQTRRGIHYNPRGYVNDTDTLVLSILSRDRDVLKQLLTTTDSYQTHELFVPNHTLDGFRYAASPLFRHFSPLASDHRRQQQDGLIGILMQRSWQIAWSTNFHNDIVRRGRWVREHLLGGRVPDLPIDAAAMIPDDPHRTLRQRQSVTRDAKCWKCHEKMDDLGLPFEASDHYGFARTVEVVIDIEAMKKSGDKDRKIYRNAALDTTGRIAFSGDPGLDGPVRDAPEMLRRLAESDRVRQVFIRHAFRYFMGRNETPGDAHTLQEADKTYIESGGSFKALLVSLLTSESFLYRTIPSEGKSS
jgi:mono/diheme cytochrome c family protein